MTNSLTVVGKVYSSDIFDAIHIFSAKTINVFAIFQYRNFNVTLPNNFLKF